MSATIPDRDQFVEEVRTFAPLMMAFLECSDELQEHAKEMLAAFKDPELDEDDRALAAMTLADILHPNFYKGLLGSDLKECEAQGAEHFPETRHVLEEMDQEEATFADRLKGIMERSGTTQAELAEKIGVGQPAISMMLQRNCRPQKKTVHKLAEALGVSPEELWPV